MTKTNKKKGFTLIELVVVIAIIGILAAVLIPGYNYFINKANQSSLDQTRDSLSLVYTSAKLEEGDDAVLAVLNEFGGTITGTTTVETNGTYKCTDNVWTIVAAGEGVTVGHISAVKSGITLTFNADGTSFTLTKGKLSSTYTYKAA